MESRKQRKKLYSAHPKDDPGYKKHEKWFREFEESYNNEEDKRIHEELNRTRPNNVRPKKSSKKDKD